MKHKTIISILIIAFLLWIGMQFYIQPGTEVISIKRISEIFFIPMFSLPELPGFLAYSMADGLWMMALCLVIMAIWEFKITSTFLLWYMVAILTGIFYEILQYTGHIHGVFDWYDIIAISIGSIIPLIFLFKTHRNAYTT